MRQKRVHFQSYCQSLRILKLTQKCIKAENVFNFDIDLNRWMEFYEADGWLCSLAVRRNGKMIYFI